MHKRDKKIKTRTIHICLTDINCSGLRSFSSTFITVYRAHCSLVGTVQHTFLGGDFMTLTIMFQSLIGTVQLFWRGVWNMTKFGRFQSLIGMVQPKSRCMIFFQMEKSHLFQSLLGTVQQQCLLRFMFSLYLISTVFQSFSPKKSVNLFIVNSCKALA